MSVALARRSVLVLNRSWTAIGIVSLERALKKVFSVYADGEPKARIIDCVNDFQTMTWEDWSLLKPAEGEASITTVNAIFRIPEVIQLTGYDKIPNRKIHFSRRTIYKRDQNTCQYCGDRPGTESLSIDHILPRSKGGLTTWENCVLACVKCNAKKADKFLHEAGMKLKKKPEKPKHNLFKGDFVANSWKTFISEAYWLTELENDN